MFILIPHINVYYDTDADALGNQTTVQQYKSVIILIIFFTRMIINVRRCLCTLNNEQTVS